MSDPLDYTVGWICATSIEYVAAQTFLDEQHENAKCLSLHDNNDYTLGKIGQHNVTIAVLPQGEDGVSSAAGVARDLFHSFPNIRLGLLVGIAGGVPSTKHDIRLGDIVVSSPCDGEGGVLYYDYGKTVQDRAFQSTGFLNQPPTILRSAVNGLKTQYEIGGHQLEGDINKVLETKPRLWKKYKRPPSSSDQLYKTLVIHPIAGDKSCVTTCNGVVENMVHRVERGKDEDNPAIHYGLIASGSQLIKDASVRDALGAERDILCFETQAAGLMNHFPCLVIRGICNYSDTHNYDEWKGYAAMSAAAYAKDLLERISPRRVEAERKITDSLSNVQDGVDEIRNVLQDHEYKAMLDWLTSVDYISQQNEYFKRRQKGTGQWLLESDEFQGWVKDRTPRENVTMFCPGIPGAGKTIMSSIVVEHLESRFNNDLKIGIAYVYLSYQPQQAQAPEDILSSILKQLIRRPPKPPTGALKLYSNHKKKGKRPSFEEISNILESSIQLHSRVFIVLDALDEYYDSDSQRQKRLLDELLVLQEKTKFSLFVTSRFVAEITSQFKDCITKEIRAQKDDILLYVDERMHELLRSMIKRHADVQQKIRDRIVEAADGMFLIARLHMDSLMTQPTLGHIKQTLQALPQGIKGLDETYAQAIQRIEGQAEGFRDLAQQILLWITHAKVALSIIEIQHALAVQPHSIKLDEDFIPHIEILNSICAGLVIVDPDSDIIQFVHYTTRQYFKRTSYFADPHEKITATCLTYLSFDAFGEGVCQTDKELQERQELFPFYVYAAKFWGYHAVFSSEEIVSIILDFLNNKNKAMASSQALMMNLYFNTRPGFMSGLHLAVYFGLSTAIISALLKETRDVNSKDSDGNTPLYFAITSRHKEIAEMLIGQEQVNINSLTNREETALMLAVRNQDEGLVKLLLTREDVEVNSSSSLQIPPLCIAARSGNQAIVKLLLADDRIEVNVRDRDGSGPLFKAVRRGREDMVKVLLGHRNIDVNATNNKGMTPLIQAAENGDEAILKLLLAMPGIDINCRSADSGYGQCPVRRAAENDWMGWLKLLLAQPGVKVDDKDKSDLQTPLSWAAEAGRENVVGILLQNVSVDVNTKDCFGRTPLWLASNKGRKGVVKLLLERHGININIRDNRGQTPLMRAVIKEHEEIVKLLLRFDRVDVNIGNLYDQTPLSRAAMNGRNKIVQKMA